MRIAKPCHRLAPLIALATTVCAMAITACGSSGQTGTGSAPSDAPGIRFAQCMRAHGVPKYPDPGGGGSSGVSLVGPGLNTSSPAFKGAQQACAKLAPALPGAPTLTASRKRALVAFAECMRAHGIPSFPDPLLTAPSAPTNGTSVIDLHGAVFVLPAGTDPQSPAFTRAGADCGVRGPS